MHLSLRLLPVLLLGWLLPAHPVRAVYPPPIKDEGMFFSKDTLEKANKKIREIYDRFHKDVVLETFPTIPADQEAKYRELGRNKFFSEWAGARVRELGINGICILISKKPGRLEIEVGGQMDRKAFTPDDLSQLKRKMLSLFEEKKFDDGLLEGLELIEKAMKANISR